MTKSKKPQTRTEWSQEEDDLLAHWFPLGGVEAVMKVVHGKTVEAVRSRARRRQLTLRPEVLRAKKQASAALAQRAARSKSVVAVQVEVIPPEYIKVPSIFRVGDRYAAQEEACV